MSVNDASSMEIYSSKLWQHYYDCHDDGDLFKVKAIAQNCLV